MRAFTDPTGVIGQIHSADQFSLIDEIVQRLASFAAVHSGPKVWVTSLYAPGRSVVATSIILSRSCAVMPQGADSAWDPRLTPPADAVVVTRTSVDAGSCAAFVEVTEAMVGAVDAVLITGFWLSACVAATATSCAQRLAGRLPVVVPLSLAATRLGLYDPEDDHPAVVDVGIQLEQLRARGVVVCDSPGRWRSELADAVIPSRKGASCAPEGEVVNDRRLRGEEFGQAVVLSGRPTTVD